MLFDKRKYQGFKNFFNDPLLFKITFKIDLCSREDTFDFNRIFQRMNSWNFQDFLRFL